MEKSQTFATLGVIGSPKPHSHIISYYSYIFDHALQGFSKSLKSD